MADNDKWTKVEPGSDGITQDWKENKELVGKYVGKKENVGANNSTMYVVEREDGQKVDFWETAVLKSRMENIKLGSMVKIVSLGKTKSEKTGRSYNNFDVFYKEPKDSDTKDEIPF